MKRITGIFLLMLGYMLPACSLIDDAPEAVSAVRIPLAISVGETSLPQIVRKLLR